MLKIINWFIEKLFPKKVERHEVMEILTEEVRKLKTMNIISLMKDDSISELETIAQQLNLSLLEIFVEKEGKLLELLVDEIPKNSCVETAFYLSRSTCRDIELIDDFDEFRLLLISEGEIIGDRLANLLETKDLCDLEVKDFVI